MAGATSQAKEHQALSFDLGRYRAGSVLAEDPVLGDLYRLLTDLSMPHFGSTALQLGPETGLQRITLAFGESAFHLGLAQLTAGWLLTLSSAQLGLALASGALTAPDELRAQGEAIIRDAARTLADSRRCRAEGVDGRFLFHNFRRAASGQPKRLML
jgi:hypothetical protein